MVCLDLVITMTSDSDCRGGKRFVHSRPFLFAKILHCKPEGNRWAIAEKLLAKCGNFPLTGPLRRAKVFLDVGSTARLAERELRMRPVDYGLVLVFLAFGGTLGWFANKAYASHSDVKTGKQRL